MEVPQKLTDAWAEWVVAQLSANGQTALTDADIAAIINRPDSATRVKLNALIATSSAATIQLVQQWTNSAIADALAPVTSSISGGDIRAVNDANDYTDTKASATLNAAMQYTDQHATPGTVTKTYVDAADTAVAKTASDAVTAAEARSGQYADTKYTDAVSAASEYTDGKLVGYVSRGTLDDELDATVAEAKGYTDTVAQTTLTDAKEYADSVGSGGGSNAYTDEQISQARSDLEIYANNADAELHTTITAEMATAIEGSTDGVAQLIDGKLADNVSYTDQGDAETLTAAKEYADNAVASGGGSGGGGVTTGYVDIGDANALANAKVYADSGDATTYTNAKAYADGKYTKPSTGIPRNDLDASTKASLNKADTASQPPGALVPIVVDTATYTANGFGYRLNNGTVELWGTVTLIAGNMPINATTNIATGLLAEARPSIAIRLPISFQGVIFGMMQISTAGTITIYTGPTTAGTMYFGGLSYPKL